MKILETESFDDTFGPKRKRKKPKIAVGDIDELISSVNTKGGSLEQKFLE